MQTPTQLSRALLNQDGFALPENVTCGPLKQFPEKVLQFGEGNFLRAFFDWMVDKTNERGLFGGRVVVAQPIQTGLSALINEQDGLYTLIARGVDGGKVVESRRVITSISRALNPYDDWSALMAFARNPELRFVVSNTTEAGIVYVDEAYGQGYCPASFPAKVAALLYERFQAVNGAASGGLVFLPCELIERNGDKLKECVQKHAQAWNFGSGFCDWLESANYFLNTLVDRIVPGYPRTEAASLAAELGYVDQLLDTAEIFHLWVIEGPSHLANELPFHAAGLNVIWTDDMSPYRTRKVRVLNGAHTASVLAAYLGGVTTVREMMEDGLFGRFVRHVVFEEIVPPLAMEETSRYADSVLERFQNPFIKHELLSISLNSVSKWKVRVLPSVLDYLSKTDRLPAGLVFSLAALIRFYKGQISDPGLTGERVCEPYTVRDDADVMEFFKRCWQAFEINRNTGEMVRTILANDSLWGLDLTTLPGMTDAVAAGLQAILTDGMRKATESVLSNTRV